MRVIKWPSPLRGKGHFIDDRSPKLFLKLSPLRQCSWSVSIQFFESRQIAWILEIQPAMLKIPVVS